MKDGITRTIHGELLFHSVSPCLREKYFLGRNVAAFVSQRHRDTEKAAKNRRSTLRTETRPSDSVASVSSCPVFFPVLVAAMLAFATQRDHPLGLFSGRSYDLQIDKSWHDWSFNVLAICLMRGGVILQCCEFFSSGTCLVRRAQRMETRDACRCAVILKSQKNGVP